ncbi:hypothetical protein, partial [Pseudolysinimonas sp.]|uniref:hypothetical protein n=1 Tax=Pseudolysinimonas sp. TaxID=2680009 RepID=UPI00286D32E1
MAVAESRTRAAIALAVARQDHPTGQQRTQDGDGARREHQAGDGCRLGGEHGQDRDDHLAEL